MDLNERLEARRKEIAEQEARQRVEAQQQLEAERESQRVQQEAERDAWVSNSSAKPDLLNRPTPAKKTVEIDYQEQQIKEVISRFTKKQWAFISGMVILFFIGVGTDEARMMWLWGICSAIYFGKTLSDHLDSVKKTTTD